MVGMFISPHYRLKSVDFGEAIFLGKMSKYVLDRSKCKIFLFEAPLKVPFSA